MRFIGCCVSGVKISMGLFPDLSYVSYSFIGIVNNIHQCVPCWNQSSTSLPLRNPKNNTSISSCMMLCVSLWVCNCCSDKSNKPVLGSCYKHLFSLFNQWELHPGDNVYCGLLWIYTVACCGCPIRTGRITMKKCFNLLAFSM